MRAGPTPGSRAGLGLDGVVARDLRADDTEELLLVRLSLPYEAKVEEEEERARLPLALPRGLITGGVCCWNGLLRYRHTHGG